MRKPNLAPWLPLGVPVDLVWRVWGCGLGFASLLSLRFLPAYGAARGELFEYDRLTGVSSLIKGAKIVPFAQLLSGVYAGFLALAAVTPLAALALYLTHYQGGRSIYTMRRLPRRSELWRRVLAVPALAALSALAAAGLVTALFAAIYWGCTPAAAL